MTTHASCVILLGAIGMNKKIEALVKRIRRLEGQYDCSQGIKPTKTSRSYLDGYGSQYEKEQRITSLNKEVHHV